METAASGLGEPTMDASPRSYKVVYGVVSRNNNNFWTRIGAAFQNRDGSWNLRLDYLPTSTETTVQIREPREREERDWPGDRTAAAG